MRVLFDSGIATAKVLDWRLSPYQMATQTLEEVTWLMALKSVFMIMIKVKVL
jgi:hypothetical protein